MLTSKNSRATQEFVPIKEIRDGVVILKDGSLRLVLIASSINFYLKSPDEQMGILTQYQDFLNSLDFPIQIAMESRRLDIKPYLATLETQLKNQTNDLIKLQTREYIEFIKNFTDTVNIMTKSFFVVVPYELTIVSANLGIFGRIFGSKNQTQSEETLKQFQEHKTQLEQRASVVEQGLSRLGIRVAQLGTEELVELYYKAFNPGESNIPSLGGVGKQ
jgi:type IV secretory pathway VirB4 component